MSAAPLPDSGSRPAYDPYLEAGAQAEHLGVARVWTLPASIERPQLVTLHKIGLLEDPLLPAPTPSRTFERVSYSGLQASQFQASAWVVQVFRVVLKTIFPSGTLPSPPFFLPSRRPRSWHPLSLPPSAPTLTPLLQGSVQARLGLLWHCGFLYYSQQTSQAPRTFELRSLLAEA